MSMRWLGAVFPIASRARAVGLRSILLAIAFGLMAQPADAQYARLGFDQFRHTRWTADEGVPNDITRIVQTPDGWLWLATSEGLYRFDGVTFERVPAPSGSPMERAPVTALLVGRSGQLWAAFGGHGGVGVFRDGRLHDMRMPQPGYVANQLAQTSDGALWVSESGGQTKLKRFLHGRWEEMQHRLALPPGGLTSMRATPDGLLWITLNSAGPQGLLVYLRPGSTRFGRSPHPIAALARAEVDRGGGLWISGPDGVRLLGGTADKPVQQAFFPSFPGFSRGSLTFDAAGGLWGTTGSAGMFQIPSAARADRRADEAPRRFTAADGLTSDTALASFADREGNVWIATEQGLDQFRPASALYERAIGPSPGEGFDLARAGDGTVYVSSSAGVFQMPPGRPPRRIREQPLHGICGGRDEGLWGFAPSGLARFRAGRWETLALPPGVQAVGACAEDRFDRLWILLGDQRLIWRHDGAWHFPTPALQAQWYDLIATPSGDIVFRQPGKLVRVSGDDTTVTSLGSSEALGIWAVAAGPRDLFVSGSDALFRVRDGRPRRLEGGRFPWATKLRGLVQTSSGETWIIRGDGVSRVSTADLDRAFDDPSAPLPRKLFDSLDGVESATQHIRFQGPQATAGADGRLWYLNRLGVSFIDPATLRANSLPPPVVIRSVLAGGRLYRDPERLVLPPGTRSVDIAYTALSFAAPQRVRFRYRLEGVDEEWIDPGARRLASYANLGPGAYRFQVIAANNDGVWNDKGETLAFEIRPTFVQSRPFKVLCALALLALLWLAYSLRMRAVADRVRLRMNERMEERERIARELHDTLLQSVQALTLRFQLAVDDLPKRAAARPGLEEAINRADQVIAEGRDRVRDLRPTDGKSDLGQVLREMAARQMFGPGVEVSITTTGTPRPLDPLVLDEVARIAGEAAFNVWRHAHARRVEIEVRHEADFSLRIADDGVGIAEEVAGSGSRDGHFGLPGMRERARKLRGELLVRRRTAHGCEVLLTVPGAVAYKSGGRRLFAWPWSKGR